ncbi:hypothetical protein ACP70R_015082 [Stipagrostis hirtigluma subsp. patula]
MDAAAATPVAVRLRRSTLAHDAYTVRLADRRVAALATARPADARRWVATTRWLHAGLLRRGRLVVGLGVQWNPPRAPLLGAAPEPAALQLCVGHRCLVFHLARADAVPEALYHFLADPRVTFVGSGSAYDSRILWVHYGLYVACGHELRALAGMGNASMEDMADRFLGYPGVKKPRDVAMGDWHAPRLSPDQVQYACVDAYLAFRLGVHLCPGGAAGPPPELVRAPPPVQRAPAVVRPAPPVQRAPVVRAAPPAPAVVRPVAPVNRAPVVVRPAPPVQRAPVVVRPAPPVKRAAVVVRRAPPAPRAPEINLLEPRIGCFPPAFRGVPMAPVGVGAANISSSNVADTRGGLTGSDTDNSETDVDVDVGDTATLGLPVRAYASDSDDEDLSSDDFEHVVYGGAFTDEEEDDDDVNEDDQEDVEGYEDYARIGILTLDDHEDDDNKEYSGTMGILTADNNRDGSEEFTGHGVATANVEEECGGGCQAFEYLGHCEAVVDDGDGALGQDDWYDQGDYELDQDDEEFFLL